MLTYYSCSRVNSYFTSQLKHLPGGLLCCSIAESKILMILPSYKMALAQKLCALAELEHLCLSYISICASRVRTSLSQLHKVNIYPSWVRTSLSQLYKVNICPSWVRTSLSQLHKVNICPSWVRTSLSQLHMVNICPSWVRTSMCHSYIKWIYVLAELEHPCVIVT